MDDAALRAVTNPRRREILRLVWDDELSSGDIASHFDVTWPAVSQNLKVLEQAGLVRIRREGTTRYYKADRSKVGPLRSVLMRMWQDDLDRLTALAEAEAKSSRGRTTKRKAR